MKKVIDWSLAEFSHLPWRKNRSLYNTLVSEIMLQQTTVGTVVNKFDPFIKKFPTIKKLAEAKEEDVLMAWEGLGYYRRARNLHKAAQTIAQNFKGVIPKDFDQLISIPGIGDYTANALLSIGHNERALAIDANIERVLARYYGVEDKTALQLKKYFKEEFKGNFLRRMNSWGPRSFHEAIMDLGRTYCQAKKVDCESCPIKTGCVARKNDNPLSIPKIIKKKDENFELILLRVISKKGKKLLAYKKDKSEWLSDQWEVPTFVLKTNDKSLKQYPKAPFKKYKEIGIFKSAITKYKIQNIVVEVEDIDRFVDTRFRYIDSSKSHLSTATKKALKHL